MTINFEIRLSQCGAMSDAVALEAIAMFAKGWVDGSTVACPQIQFSVERTDDQSFRILGTLCEFAEAEGVQSTDMRPWIAIYCVMAGFWSSNCSVQYIGLREETMPGQGRRLKRKSVSSSITKPFEDLTPKVKRTKPIQFKTLAEIHHWIAQHETIETLVQSDDVIRYVPSLDTKPSFAWVRHKSGLLIDFNFTKSNNEHRIGGVKYTAEPIIRNCSRMDTRLTRVSTWGEAWVRLDTLPNETAVHLQIFRDEVGMFAEELRRYSIEDIDTLRRRSTLSFGTTATKHFTASEMMAFSEIYALSLVR